MYSKDSGTEGTLHVRSEPQWQPERAVSHRERRPGQAELELARQQLERQQPGASLRNSFRFQAPPFSAGLGFVLPSVRTSLPAFSQLSPRSPKVHRTSLCRVLSTPTQPLEEYEACRASVLPYGDRVLCLRAAGNSLPPSPRLSRLRGHQSVPRESIASCSVCLGDTRTIRYKPLSRILGLAESSGGGVRFA